MRFMNKTHAYPPGDWPIQALLREAFEQQIQQIVKNCDGFLLNKA
jgi:hypothetical protein